MSIKTPPGNPSLEKMFCFVNLDSRPRSSSSSSLSFSRVIQSELRLVLPEDVLLPPPSHRRNNKTDKKWSLILHRFLRPPLLVAGSSGCRDTKRLLPFPYSFFFACQQPRTLISSLVSSSVVGKRLLFLSHISCNCLSDRSIPLSLGYYIYPFDLFQALPQPSSRFTRSMTR